MKKSRLFMALGTFALVITAMFATKANNKKFNAFTGTIFYGSSYAVVGSTCSLGGAILQTTNVHGKATIAGQTLYRQSGATFITLYY